MLCFKGDLSWRIYYAYEGNSRFNPTRRTSSYIIDRLCAEAVESPAYISTGSRKLHGLNCCNDHSKYLSQ